jgi:hypothetical protein
MSTLHSAVQISQDVLFRELDGEAVLLHLDTGKYFGLDAVGARMWALLAQHGALEPAYRSLLAEYEVAPDVLERDFTAFVDRLAAQQLLAVRDA